MEKIIRCLLVDDDIDDREIFLMTLTELGGHIRCRTAANGVEALHLLEAEHTEPPDFIFLDINMPRMNGLDCLRQLRKSDRFDNSGIFIYSTTAEPSLVEQSKSLNAGFIVKPVRTSDLKETLNSILNS